MYIVRVLPSNNTTAKCLAEYLNLCASQGQFLIAIDPNGYYVFEERTTMSEVLYTWTSIEKRCEVCDGGEKPPRWGCWRCHGAGVYRVARLIPVAADRACGSDSDDENSTRAAGELVG